MEFIFKAKDQQGNFKEGKIEAISKEAAISVLQQNSLIPTSIEQGTRGSNTIRDLKKIWEGVTQKELVIFFRQFSILIDAKVPIIPSLRTIGDQTDNSFLRLVINEIVQDIEDGMPLSEGFAKHPEVFSSLTINMIKSGEISGNLQKSVAYVADNIEKNYQLTSKIKGALFYPGFVISVAGIIGFLVITFILPKLTVMFKEMQVAIPWYTRLLMNIGDFMASYWWAVLIGIIGLIVGFIYYLKTEAGKKEWDQLKIKLPVLGNLFRDVYMTRFADNLAVLLAGGIPIVRALVIVGDIIENKVYQSIILRAADEVKAGGTISSVFAKSADIPPIVSRMVKIGEETGKLSEILKKVAGFYEEETDRITRNLATLIEPVLIVFLGIGVAIMVFAILMPIYDIADKI